MDSTVKRLFIATFIDNSLFENIYTELIKDFSNAVTGKWVELPNLHFTYKFLGNVDSTRIPEIESALKSSLKKYDSKLSIKGLGVLPNISKAKILYAGVFNLEKILIKQQAFIENQLAKLGFQ
jgi:2'-5' RNA ligase